MMGDNNSCILLGIVPPDQDLFHLIRNRCNFNNVSWSDEYVIVPDQENGGIPTLVMTAFVMSRMMQNNAPGVTRRSDDDMLFFRDQEDTPLLNPPVVVVVVKTPQDLVNCVTEFLKTATRTPKNNKKETPHPRVELWASAPAPLPLWNASRSTMWSHCSSSSILVDRCGDITEEQEQQNGKNIISKENDDARSRRDLLFLLDPSLRSQDNKAYITLRKWGIVLQKKVLNLTEVKKIRSIVDEAIQEVELSLSVHRPDIQVGKDTIIFREIASRNLERFDLKLTSDAAMNFVQDHVLQSDIVQDFLTQSLGDLSHIDFDVSVVYSKPGANTQGWHADGAHVSAFHDAGWDADGWRTRLADAYAICLFIPLIDLDYEVGYTQFWPGSHRSRDLVGFGPVAELTCSTLDAIGSAGDGIWYDYRLLHRGMPNNSSQTIRPVLQILFKKKWYVERANYGKQSISLDNDIIKQYQQ